MQEKVLSQGKSSDFLIMLLFFCDAKGNRSLIFRFIPSFVNSSKVLMNSGFSSSATLAFKLPMANSWTPWVWLNTAAVANKRMFRPGNSTADAVA